MGGVVGEKGHEAAAPRRPWWRDAVVYQIYPRSFASARSGVGDLDGIREHLGHLAWLGVDGFWLSPIYPSPMADFGYDVSDYCGVDPVFGDLGDFDRLLAASHRVDLRVLLDWVPNHTSDRHPWFLESRSSRHNDKREWYVWRDGRDGPDGPEPNNWRAAFGGRAWTWDDRTGQRYLHLFLPQQPDLNWNNPEVERALHDVLRFWLDRGVDGFRADVVHLIGKDPSLPDQPAALAGVDLVGVHDDPRTHDLLRRIRAVIDDYPGDRTMVGEVNLPGARRIAPYYGRGDELPLVFDFALLSAPWDAAAWARIVQEAEDAFTPIDACPVWALSNHDQVRQRTRYGGSEDRARVAAFVLLTLRGTVFLYQGEELGLENAVVPADERVDPGGRDGCRAPLPWTAQAGYGWPATPWLPFPPDAGARNPELLSRDPDSILHLYRRLIAARRATPALHGGRWTHVGAPAGVLAYDRVLDDDVRRVVANFSGEPSRWRGDGAGWLVELDSSRPSMVPGAAWDGVVPPETAVLLRPG